MPGEAELESGKCLICEAPNSSMSFGIDACRACTSFFKRAQLSGRRYLCRQGDHKCAVLRDVELMCRGCRYDKCAAVGMIYDGPMRVRRRGKEGPCEPQVTPESLLQRIGREHGAFVDHLRVIEQEIVRRHNLPRLPHLSEEVYLANFDITVVSFNAMTAAAWQFFVSVFPSLNGITFEDQREFFRLCLPQFGMIDCFFRTKRTWGGFKKYLLFSAIFCTDLDNPEHWIGQDSGEATDEQIRSIRTYFADQMALIAPSFDKADILPTEKCALLPLILCESEKRDDFVNRYGSFLDGIRKETLNDLHHFYTEQMGLTEYSARLGNLFTICHTFREGNDRFQEWFRMQATIFDLYATETLVKNLLM